MFARSQSGSLTLYRGEIYGIPEPLPKKGGLGMRNRQAEACLWGKPRYSRLLHSEEELADRFVPALFGKAGEQVV